MNRTGTEPLSTIRCMVVGIIFIALVIVVPCTGPAQESGARLSRVQGSEAGGAATDGDIRPERSAAGVSIPGALKRGFYLTNSYHSPTEAPTVCTRGYHMASIWELMEVSTLNYHYKHPYALVFADSGYGPPSYAAGWVRTGLYANSSTSAGQGNCMAWTSNDSSYHGTAVQLTANWTTSPGALGPWEARVFTCDTTVNVWCVSNTK